MWVRSQDRSILTNARHFEITEYEIGYVGNYIIFSNNDSNEIAVAKYSSRKKAMKVMDMLEKHINKSNNYYNQYNGECNTIATQEIKVFQFPKDEEVNIDE